MMVLQESALSACRTDIEDDLSYIKHQPIFRKGADKVDYYPHVHDQLRNVSITSNYRFIIN